MKKLKWGIIGCGGIADRRTIPGILKTKNSEVYAVMDVNPEVSNTIKAKYGFEKAYYNVQDICNDKNIDVIYIATPVCYHKEQALTAIEAGKNVFIEKPMAYSSEDAKLILDKAKEKKVHIMIGYIMRYHNLHLKMKKIIAEGGIGKVVCMRSQFSCWYPDIKGAWRQNKKMSAGGTVMDLGVHCIDIMQFVSGEEIKDIKSFYDTKTFKYEVEDSAAILFNTEKNIYGHIDVNFNIPDDATVSKLEVYGTKGTLIAEGTLGQTEAGKLKYLYSPQGDYSALQNRKEAKAKIYYGGKKDIYAKQAEEFATGILKDESDYSFAESSVKIQKICEKIYSDKY